MEYYFNIVFWQMICEECGVEFWVVLVNDVGEIDLDVFYELLDECVKIVFLVYVFNVLGMVNFVKVIIDWVYELNIFVLVDGV